MVAHDLGTAAAAGNPLSGPRTPACPPTLTHPLLDWLTACCDTLDAYHREAPAAPWQVELLRGTWWVGPARPTRRFQLFARIAHGTPRANRATARIMVTARNLMPGVIESTRAILATHSGRADYILSGGPCCPACGRVWPCPTLRLAALPFVAWQPGYDPTWRPDRGDTH